MRRKQTTSEMEIIRPCHACLSITVVHCCCACFHGEPRLRTPQVAAADGPHVVTVTVANEMEQQQQEPLILFLLFTVGLLLVADADGVQQVMAGQAP